MSSGMNVVDFFLTKNAKDFNETSPDIASKDTVHQQRLGVNQANNNLLGRYENQYKISELPGTKINHQPSFDGYQYLDYSNLKNSKGQSPSFQGIQSQEQNTKNINQNIQNVTHTQNVSFQVFEIAVQKLQQQIQLLQLNSNVVETLRDQYIHIEQRLDNLEQLQHMDQNLYKLKHQEYSNNNYAHNYRLIDQNNIPSTNLQTAQHSPTHDKQESNHQRSDKSTIKRNQVKQNLDDSSGQEIIYAKKQRSTKINITDEIDQLRREMKKDVYDRFENVERYIHKFLSQAKEIDDKVSILANKQKQSTEVISSNEENVCQIYGQIEQLKKEYSKKFSSLQRNTQPQPSRDEYPTSNHSLHDLKKQQNRTDAEIIKIFTQVKRLLDLDYKTTKIQTDVEQLKYQSHEQDFKLKEVQSLIYTSKT